MSQSICPRSSKSFLESPDHLSLAMAVVLLILSPVYDSLGPVKLTYTLHLAFAPFSIVALAIEPSVGPMPVKEICVEVALVVFQELDPSIMLNHKILIFSHGFRGILGRNPFVVFLQFLAQLMFIDVLLLHEVLDLQNLLRWLFLFILDS